MPPDPFPEQGEEPLPEDFVAPDEPEAEAPDGDLAEGSEARSDWEEDHHPRWHDYYLVIDVCEEGVWVPVGYRRKAERLLGCPVEKFPGWALDDEEGD